MDIRSAIIALSMAMAGSAYAAEPLDRGAVPTTRAFPELTLIYEVPGVKDNGSADNLGTATSFECFNTDSVNRSMRFVVRGQSGIVLANETFPIFGLHTLTVSTHGTVMFAESILSTHTISQGGAFIFSTSPNIFCTAMIVDAESASPQGIALHMVRRNPAAGAIE